MVGFFEAGLLSWTTAISLSVSFEVTFFGGAAFLVTGATPFSTRLIPTFLIA